MKNLFIVCCSILAFCYNSFATLINVPLNELVKDSDIIIIGTLQDVSEYSYGGVNNGEGRILIEQIISGKIKTDKGLPPKSGDKLKLVWSEDFACVYGMHRRTANQKGIWFLKVEKDGTVISGHPQRFKSSEELTEIRNALEKASLSDREIKVVDISGRTYSAFNALIVIFTALILYYFLYRSRFKIR